MPHKLVAGGESRFESVRNGLEEIRSTDGQAPGVLIAVHDAVRPLINPDLIDLSYAEAKFLSLARIIATGSRIWLLDEPASGLDVHSRSRFISLLRDATARGVTICLIEHNLDVMTEIADRIAFLDRGKKLAEDVPAKVLQDPELIAIYFGKSK